MDRRSRVCILIIVLGLANYLAYTVGYFVFVGGEALIGEVRLETQPDGSVERSYYVGHRGRDDIEKPAWVWMYSAIHSTSVWLTFGAVLLAMLTLAKDRIVSSMRRTVIRGRTFITVLATLITAFTLWMVFYFTWLVLQELTNPAF